MSKLFDAIYYFAEAGLVVWDDYNNSKLSIGRPSSVEGTKFRGMVDDIVTGISDFTVMINAPLATLTQKSNNSWVVDISLDSAPGPGPVWFHEDFETLKEAVQAVLDCYFSNRINFQNESLEAYYGSRE